MFPGIDQIYQQIAERMAGYMAGYSVPEAGAA